MTGERDENHFRNALENDPARTGGVLAMIAHVYGVENVAGKKGCLEKTCVWRGSGKRGPCVVGVMLMKKAPRRQR